MAIASCLVDTNILLRIARRFDPQHKLVDTALARLAVQGTTFHYTHQNIAELWNAMTRPQCARLLCRLSRATLYRRLSQRRPALARASRAGFPRKRWRRTPVDLPLSTKTKPSPGDSAHNA